MCEKLVHSTFVSFDNDFEALLHTVSNIS